MQAKEEGLTEVRAKEQAKAWWKKFEKWSLDQVKLGKRSEEKHERGMDMELGNIIQDWTSELLQNPKWVPTITNQWNGDTRPIPAPFLSWEG